MKVRTPQGSTRLNISHQVYNAPLIVAGWQALFYLQSHEYQWGESSLGA